MPLMMAISAWYRHPGRRQARIRAYFKDENEIVETYGGQEISAGPVEFGTDFGNWSSQTIPHGGWNVDGRKIWFAFNCRGQGNMAKYVFEPVGGFKLEGAHPYQDGVTLELVVESIAYRLAVPLTICTWNPEAWGMTEEKKDKVIYCSNADNNKRLRRSCLSLDNKA